MAVGLYPDGRPGELFVDVAKAGTALRAWAGVAAKLLSLMLQYGVPLSEITEALDGTNSVPFTDIPVTGHPGLERCAGELDYIAKALAMDFPDDNSCADADAWDVLADGLDRIIGGEELTAEEVRVKLTARGADEALDSFLEVMEDE
jgi:ribonucleoside-diphosphate reductase alpha chain